VISPFSSAVIKNYPQLDRFWLNRIPDIAHRQSNDGLG
jgi:hypothetical protein